LQVAIALVGLLCVQENSQKHMQTPSRLQGKNFVRTGRLAEAVAVFGLVLSPGCSLFFVDGPPPADVRERGVVPNCTTSVAFPVVDALLASYFLVNLMINASKNASEFPMGEQQRAGALAFGGLFTGWAAISSGVGFSRVGGCDDAIAEAEGGQGVRIRRRPSVRPARANPEATTSQLPNSGAGGGTGVSSSVPAPGAAPAYPPAQTPAPTGPVDGGAGSPSAVPPAPTVPSPPPAQQMEDDDDPRSRRRPRSSLVPRLRPPLIAAVPFFELHLR
jgi:F0F1-type ATP synthase membrane subunit c/vacuolar-type H+-ATPase subunit K